MIGMTIIKKKDVCIEKDMSSNPSSFVLEKEESPILCNHCLRSASNGIRCMGICVADNEY